MVDLTDVPTADLRAELGRRVRIGEERYAREIRETIDREYGKCKKVIGVDTPFQIGFGDELADPGSPCDADFRRFEIVERRDILASPDDWPPLLPAPPERCWLVGWEGQMKLTCQRGHDTFIPKTVLFEKPLKPFG